MIFRWRRIVEWCVVLAAIAIALLIRQSANWLAQPMFVLAILWAFIRSFTLIDPIADAYRRAMQKDRDLRAVSRLDDMRKGEITFFLYLRPFASTGGVQVVRSIVRRKNDFRSHIGPTVRWDDLEALLERHLEPYGLLIGLGRPGEHVGAGRIASNDEDWQQLVENLAANARLIFLLPAMDNGTRWEMDLILARPILLGKTVFVVPGSGKDLDYLQAANPRFPMDAQELLYWQSKRRQDPLITSRHERVNVRFGGARHDPQRSVAELRQGAIDCLRAIGAYDAAAQAELSPTPTLLMLNSRLGVQRSYPLDGHIGMAYGMANVGNKYWLDMNTFRRTLAELMRDEEDPDTPMMEKEDPDIP